MGLLNPVLARELQESWLKYHNNIFWLQRDPLGSNRDRTWANMRLRQGIYWIQDSRRYGGWDFLRFSILQKRARCLLYFTDWHEHAIPLFLEANMLPITFLYYESISTLMYDINNSCRAPTNMLNLFQKMSNIHSYNTRLSTSEKFLLKVLDWK